MRTLAVAACFTFASLLSACSPNLGEGRVLCASTVPFCPDGYSCVNGRCYRGAPDASTEFDASEDDVLTLDAGPDAWRPSEVCTPSAAGAEREDEDGDGMFDEGCELSFGPAHPVTDALPPEAAAILFPRISDDGLTLTFCRVFRLDQQAWQATRTSTNARFGAPSQLTFASTFSACAAQPYDGRYFFEARRSNDPNEVDHIYEGSSRAASELNTMVGVGGSGHPFVSAAGTELFFEGNRMRDAYGLRSGGLYVSSRTAEGAIGTPRPIVFAETAPTSRRRDMFPTLSPDGLTLFFVRVSVVPPATMPPTERSAAMFATRAVVGEPNFSAPVELPIDLSGLGSFSPSFSTWEVFSSSASVYATAGNLNVKKRNEGLLRARLCAGACPPPTEVPCELGTRSADGLRCYTVESASASYARAVGICSTGGSLDGLRRRALASVHSNDERGLLFDAGTPSDRWVGTTNTDSGWVWASGEPNTDSLAASVFWADGEPSATTGSCVALSLSATREEVTGGFGVRTDCSVQRTAVCETDLWPTW